MENHNGFLPDLILDMHESNGGGKGRERETEVVLERKPWFAEPQKDTRRYMHLSPSSIFGVLFVYLPNRLNTISVKGHFIHIINDDTLHFYL